MSDRPARALLRRDWMAVAAAVAIAHLFYWRIVVYPSDFDARNYVEIAEDILRNGLFSKFYYSELRTYAYPLFLAVLLRVADLAHVSFGWLLFETQLAAYLLAAYAVRQRLAALCPDFAGAAFIAIAVNPFALSYTPESLSESVSVSLMLFVAGCWLALVARLTWRTVLAGSIAVGVAVMVRPANVFALFAWIVGVIAASIAARVTPRVAAAIAVALVVGIAAPMAPQYANNVLHYGRHTPLVAAALARNQQIWGIANLKYATAMPPVPNPSIFYENPFAQAGPVDDARPLAWYVRHPRAGALTLGLHAFNMLDQDLLFTYSRDLDPWYRIPLGLVTHAMVAAALIGIAILIARARRNRNDALAATVVVAFVAAHVVVHATTAVEMRFGLPLRGSRCGRRDPRARSDADPCARACCRRHRGLCHRCIDAFRLGAPTGAVDSRLGGGARGEEHRWPITCAVPSRNSTR